MTKKKPTRRPASKHLKVIDNLNATIYETRVTVATVAELVGIKYVTLDKYLKKERNVNEEVAKRMIVATNLLNKMLLKGILPIPDEINRRYRTAVALERINNFLE